jgi:hypothetical protein
MNNDDFNISVQVGEVQFQIDGLLVMAEIALTGVPEPTNAQLIEIVKRCLRPKNQASAVTDAEALAIGLRVSMKLRDLGKALAP